MTLCPDGCFSSLWSSMWTWHGQGLALGAAADDALNVWPGFKSNVTIKQCRTVILDLDLSIQLYSVVVWGTLRILDRGPNSLVSLRSTCINVKPGGKILAGEEGRPVREICAVCMASKQYGCTAVYPVQVVLQ